MGESLMSRHSSNSRRWREKIRPAVLELYNYQCVVCGTSENLTVDHIVPKSKGGTDDFENLQVMCHKHNTSKGVRLGPVVKAWRNPKFF